MKRRKIGWKTRLPYIFPYPTKGEIKYDKTIALSYVTPAIQSQKMLNSLVSMFHHLYGVKNNIVIIESNGGLGGDTITYARDPRVAKIYSTELDAKRFEMLKHNVSLFRKKATVALYNENFIDWFKETIKGIDDQNVCCVIDPPWGGIEYKESNLIEDLYMDDDSGKRYGMMDLIKMVGPNVSLVALKLPFNYDFSLFKASMQKYYVMSIKKIRFVIIDSKDII